MHLWYPQVVQFLRLEGRSCCMYCSLNPGDLPTTKVKTTNWILDVEAHDHALEMILRAVSPIPIGRIPGCLSKTCSRQASQCIYIGRANPSGYRGK